MRRAEEADQTVATIETMRAQKAKRVADMTDALEAGTLDWEKDIMGPVEACLGYSIEADGLLEELAEEIQ